MKLSLFIGVLSIAFVGTLSSCSNNEDLTEKDELQVKGAESGKMGEFMAIDDRDSVISMFKSHYAISRALDENADLLSSYDMDKVVKIGSSDGSLVIYAIPSYDGKGCLMGYPSKDGKEVTYLFKIDQSSDDYFRISNEVSEPMLDLTYKSSDNLFYVAGVYENDGIPVVISRVAADSFICNVGMAVVGEACCSAAGLTGGASLVFAACWAAATYMVCP